MFGETGHRRTGRVRVSRKGSEELKGQLQSPVKRKPSKTQIGGYAIRKEKKHQNQKGKDFGKIMSRIRKVKRWVTWSIRDERRLQFMGKANCQSRNRTGGAPISLRRWNKCER
ncbi:unnamed protein product [Arabis nemorensis]|uniref:Uncharacterized protein n=1 Tax=Arabis nemorensis TaxID=586526 RepID=A0A565BNC2_9BRAS|nr:unnamed protein product [Arabis nemorensis]